MLELYFLEIDPYMRTDCFHKLLEYVSEEKKQRIRKFQRPDDAKRCLFGDLLVKYALFQKIGCNHFVFDINQYGKPFLINYQNIHFNISHSGKWVVCATDVLPVGIDIEEIKPTDLKIAESFFSPSEYTSLLEQPLEKRTEFFYSLWTLKESYIKAKGKGLYIPLDSFSISISHDTSQAFLNYPEENYYLYNFKLESDYIGAVCSFNHPVIEPVFFSVASFLNQLALQYGVDHIVRYP